MKTILAFTAFVLLLSRALANEAELSCGYAAFGAAPVSSPESPAYRKYAPNREIDILHLTLEVTPEFTQRTVAGSATWKFQPIAKPFAELKLDAVDLTVVSVSSSEKILGYQVTDEQVVVTFAEPIAVGKEASVTINYRATPQKGLYFRTPELGFAAEDMHLWTQGEPHEARHWYPSYDYPNEKFTTEMICHVADGIVVLSNGRKVSEEKDTNGLTAVRWLQDKPHANYLVALVAGRLKAIEDKHRDIPLRFWTPASEIQYAANSFTDTKPAMEFFEKEIGVPYPWAKYDQVCIQDYHWGGMENTTLTTLNINTLFPTNYENVRTSQGLVAHELAHQWFGDLVTCKDWSHIWLNEGFASYYDLLYTEHKNGRDEFLYRLHEGAKSLTGAAITNKSIVWRKYGDAVEQFDSLAYGKGSWVLHMLRSQLGPELYRKCIKTYVERHQFGSVVTDDLRAVIEELSGRSWDQFFDQWVYHAGTPTLEVDYSWDERAKLAKISVRQTQQVNENVVLFNLPLPVRFKTKSGVVEREIIVKEKSEDFYIPLPQAPELVRIDPNLTVLARINFRIPAAMLNAMLADKADVVGRFLAVEQLQERKDAETIAKLAGVLNDDPYWAVRIAASKALRVVFNDDAFKALQAARKQQPDARVRRQVVLDVTAFYRPEAFAEAQKVIEEEKNPDIIAAAIGALGSLTGAEVKKELIGFVEKPSFRNHLADSAMTVMRAQSDPAFIEPLRETVVKREKEFTTRNLSTALGTLAALARDEEKKDSVRELLLRYVNDPRESVQLAALRALGVLEDPQTLPVLERFAAVGKQTPQRTTAERSIEQIRDKKKAAPEIGDLRRELLNLQRENREMKKDLETLKKKIEAGVAPKSEPLPKPKPVRR